MILSNIFTEFGTSAINQQNAQQSIQSNLQVPEQEFTRVFSSSTKPLKKRRHTNNFESELYSKNAKVMSDHAADLPILAASASHQLQQNKSQTPASLYFLPVIHTTHMYNKYMYKFKTDGNNVYIQEQGNTVGDCLGDIQCQHKLSNVKVSAESYHNEDSTFIKKNRAQGCELAKGKTKTSKSESSVTLPLSHSEDKEKLSRLQCFLREQIEMFIATAEDATTYSRGRNKRVEVGQAGIRCKHCGTLSVKDRSKGSTYFPSTLAGIYQAAQNMYHYHFCTGCPVIAQKYPSHFNEIISSRSCYGGGKDYWSMSAKRMGLIETAVGLKFKNCSSNPEANQFCSKVDEASLRELELVTKNTSNIVKPDDRSLITDYMYMLFSQMIPCHPAQKPTENALPGLVCKHCEGCNGSGVFFRTKVSSLSKNDNLAQIDKHLIECRYCPDETKSALKNLKETHCVQTRGLKRGHKKAFFTQMMARVST